MRDILDKLDDALLTESVGLANRKQGETFINPQGDLLTFIGLRFFPESGKFDDPDDMRKLIDQIQERKSTEIEWVNNPLSTTSAFGLAEFLDTDNNIRLFGRYYNAIAPIFTANFWPNSGLPDGFRYNKVTSLKATAGFMPQDVLTSLDNLTPADILEQVTTKFGDDHPLTKITAQVVAGHPFPLSVNVSSHPDIEFTSFRDYFCEILQPIAVIKGTATGNAAEAEKIFFGKKGFGTSKVSFSSGKSTGLYDSILTDSTGKQIKISTKGGVGAAASVKNLTDAVADIKRAGNSELLTEYKDVIEIVELVNKSGQSQSPLRLAEKFGIISGKESTIINGMKTSSKFTLTRNLQRIYDEKAARSNKEKMVPYYTILSAVAEKVAEFINENTNFSEAAAAILNHSALVQVYTKASEGKGSFLLKEFYAVYPSESVAGVSFFSGKTYYTSGIKGNFTFKIQKKGEAPPSDEPVDDIGSIADIDMDTAAAAEKIVKGGNVDLRPPGAGRLRKPKDVSKPRERR